MKNYHIIVLYMAVSFWTPWYILSDAADLGLQSFCFSMGVRLCLDLV